MISPSPEQQAVIDHPVGPLRIAAGAGTGKTTTIALRLGAAVGSGVPPEAALGMTFTNKAAEELAHHLRQILPDESAAGREVQVTTYHGFAHALLQEFGALVGVERDAKIITAGFTRQLLTAALERTATQHLDLTAFAHRVAEAARLGTSLANRLARPEGLMAIGGDDVADLRADLARVLVAYGEDKRRLGVVDYGDLLMYAHRLVTEHADIARRIGSRYQVVLLDEYQDTNPAQRELLRALFAPGAPVTAVGDPDQTIYEWRGASAENFSRFPQHFPTADGRPAVTLPLTLNRRSGRRILDVANSILDELHGPDALHLNATADAAAGTVALGWFHSAVSEAQAIAAEARRLHDDEDVPWGAMAVLLRMNRQVAIVRDALEIEEIPLQVAAVGGLLGVPEVADLYAWLRLLGRPHDDSALIRIAVGSRTRLGLDDLHPLGYWVRRHEDSTLIDALEQLDEVEGIGVEARRRLEELHTSFRQLMQTAQAVTLVELCRTILDHTGAWLDAESLPPASHLTSQLNLHRFLDLAERWSPLEGRPSLRAFLDYLEVLAEEDDAAELDTAVPSAEEAVTLVTVHRAKGLEWPVVFLPGLASGIFPTTSRRFPDPLLHPDVAPDDVAGLAETRLLPVDAADRRVELRRRHRHQELRTAYVGITRAKERLYGSGAFWYSLGKARSPSIIFALVEAAGADWWHREPDAGDPPERLGFDVAQRGPDPDFSTGWPEVLSAAEMDPRAPAQMAAALGVGESFEVASRQLTLMLEGLPQPSPAAADEGTTVSASALVAFARCPRAYAYGYVARLPTRPSYARHRGTELHRRIELHHLGRMTLLDSHPEPGEIAPAPGAYNTFLGSRFARERPVHVERSFRFTIGGTVIRGRIDAVFSHSDGSWEVVDYKSGPPRDDPWLNVQLQSYAVAVMELGLVPRDAELRVTFAHIGNPISERTETADPKWLEEARLRLVALVSAISAEEFDADPGEKCRACDFRHVCEAGMQHVGADIAPGPRDVTPGAVSSR